MTIFQRILVPIDGSETSGLGQTEAIRIARLSGGKLRFLHVIDELSFALALDAYAGHPDDWLGSLREAGRKLLDRAIREAADSGVQAEGIVHESLRDRMANAVASEARKWPADLIVLGTHGRRGLGRALLGSGAEGILRAAPVPVLLVRPQPPASQSKEPASEPQRVAVVTGALRIE